MRAADCLCTRLGQTEVQHFSFCDQLFHRTGYVFNWHVRIDPVLVIQIDAVGSEALQGFLNHFPDVLRSAVKNKTALLIVEAKFGCDSDSVADRCERLSDKLFVRVGSAPSERRLSWPRRRRAPPLPPDFGST